MVMPHRHDERGFKQGSVRKALAGLPKGPDREIKLAAIQEGRHIAQAGRAQVEPYSRRRGSYGHQQRRGQDYSRIVVDGHYELAARLFRDKSLWFERELHVV